LYLVNEGLASSLNLLWLSLKSSFHGVFEQVRRCELEEIGHSASAFGIDPAGGHPAEEHGQCLADGICVTQRVKDTGAEAGSGADGCQAGAAKFLMEVTKGAGWKRGRLAEASIGFGVAAKRVRIGAFEAHGLVSLLSSMESRSAWL
jgi:hypothetical protein